MSGAFRCMGLFTKTDNKLILFNSFGGRKFNDSPKVLFEAMLNDPRFAGYKFVWAFEEPEKCKISGAKSIKIDSPEYFKTALKAKVWISSVNIERGLHFKKRSTIYINTWHGAGTKLIGNACNGRKDPPSVPAAVLESVLFRLLCHISGCSLCLIFPAFRDSGGLYISGAERTGDIRSRSPAYSAARRPRRSFLCGSQTG